MINSKTTKLFIYDHLTDHSHHSLFPWLHLQTSTFLTLDALNQKLSLERILSIPSYCTGVFHFYIDAASLVKAILLFLFQLLALDFRFWQILILPPP